jgi:hypothetical protein
MISSEVLESFRSLYQVYGSGESTFGTVASGYFISVFKGLIVWNSVELVHR